jgi:hypothetical protein
MKKELPGGLPTGGQLGKWPVSVPMALEEETSSPFTVDTF